MKLGIRQNQLKKKLIGFMLGLTGLCALVLGAGPIMAAANIALITSESGPLAGGNVVYVEGDFTSSDKIVKLDSSYGAFVATSNTGHAYLWGYDGNGDTANGYYGPYTSSGNPNAINEVHTAVGLDKIRIKQVFPAESGYYMFAVTDEDEVYGWGQKGDGELADGGDHVFGSQYMYGAVVKLTDRLGWQSGETLKKIAANYSQGFALTSSNRLIGWGISGYCALGFDDYALNQDNGRDSLPTDLTANFTLHSGETIADVFSGVRRGSVLTSEGRVLAWGYDEGGSVVAEDPGSYSFTNPNISQGVCAPIDITANLESSFAAGEKIAKIYNYDWTTNTVLTDQGSVYLWGGWPSVLFNGGNPIYTPYKVAENAKFAAYVDGDLYVVTSDGRLMFMGGNDSGQSGANDAGTSYPTLTDVTGNFSLNTGEKIEWAICNNESKCAALTDQHGCLSGSARV